jgi:anti-sigma regulatory factor (Ser/Thr protein kinase)
MAAPGARSSPSSHVRIDLDPGPGAPAAARRALRALELGERRDDVLLMASELVTNAVRHAGLEAGDKLVLEADRSVSTVHVEVRDTGRRFRRGPRGYGLRVVDTAADRWGIECDAGTRAWFEVDERGARG